MGDFGSDLLSRKVTTEQMAAFRLFLISAADLREFGNLRCRQHRCCSLTWDFGFPIFPLGIQHRHRLSPIGAKTWEKSCCQGNSCGDSQRCFEAVRRQIVGEYEVAVPLCDGLSRDFRYRIMFS